MYLTFSSELPVVFDCKPMRLILNSCNKAESFG